MEYGILTPQGWRLDLMGIQGAREKWATCDRVIRALDADGWESLWVYDHFHTFPIKNVEATFESWSLMSHMAAVTTKCRIGQLVTCNEYRHPAYLAKIAACVDVMSGGRVNVGIGSGWFAEEFEAYGYDFRTVGARLRRLEESLQIFKSMWTEERTDFDGKHFQLKDAICEPKPLQAPHPPIVIGGRGEKVLLRLVAQYADVWNYNGAQDEFARYRDILKAHCKDVGRDFDEIRITCVSGGIAYENQNELDAYKARIAPQGLDADFLLRMVSCNGSREQCTEFLARWRDLGVDGVMFYFNDVAYYGSGDSQPEIFKKDIFPSL